MVRVGGQCLIDHQIAALRAVGVSDIAVVVGYSATSVRTHLGSKVSYIENHEYADTNSLFSLWLTRDWVRGSFMLMNADVLAHPDVFRRVMDRPSNALAFDSRSGDDAEHMKITLKDRFVQSMSKSMPPDKAEGENVGILRIDGGTAPHLFTVAGDLLRAGGHNLWAPACVDAILKEHPFEGIDIADLPWTEIDFPSDLEEARESTWVRISGKERCDRTNGSVIGTSSGSSHPIAREVG